MVLQLAKWNYIYMLMVLPTLKLQNGQRFQDKQNPQNNIIDYQPLTIVQ